MSITKTRTFIEKSGCGWITGGAIIFVLVAGMFYTCDRGQQPVASTQKDNSPKVATVGGLSITSGMVQMGYEQRQMRSTAPPTPETELAAYGATIYELVNNGLQLEALKANGINPTNEEILKLIEPSIDMRMMLLRFNLQNQGVLKRDATQADFDAVLKQRTGKDQATLQKEELALVKEDLSDPAKRPAVLVQVASDLLREKFTKETKVTDEEIRKSYDTYEFKRIRLGTGADAQKKTQEALSALKGGMSFEAAMEKFSVEPAAANKTKAESTTKISYTLMLSTDYYAPLLGLKPGEQSSVINEPGVGPTIYKLIGIKSSPPKDWEKSKEELRTSLASQKANAFVTKELDKVRNSATITWDSPGYKVLYEYMRVINDPARSLEAASNPQIMRSIADQAAAVPSTDSVGYRMAVLTRFGAFNQLWLASKPEEQAKLEDERLQTLEDVLVVIESPDVRLDIAELLLKRKDGKGAMDQLLAAANGNLEVTGLGQARYSRVYAILDKLKAANMADEEQVKAIEQAQKAWQERSLEQAKFEAEEAKMRKEAAARAAEERRKAEEERKRELEQNKPIERGKEQAPKPADPITTGGQGSTGN